MSPNSPNNTTTTVLGPDEDLAGTSRPPASG